MRIIMLDFMGKDVTPNGMEINAPNRNWMSRDGKYVAFTKDSHWFLARVLDRPKEDAIVCEFLRNYDDIHAFISGTKEYDFVLERL